MTSPNSNNSLLTTKSLSLSLAPPRSPPFSSSHHYLLRGKNPSSTGTFLTSTGDLHGDEVDSRSAAQKDQSSNKLLGNQYHDNKNRTQRLFERIYLKQHPPHPHLRPTSEHWSTRLLFNVIPKWYQNNNIRDNGNLRRFADGLVTVNVPALALTNPRVTKEFVMLGQRRIELRYGERHEMQKLDFFLPDDNKNIRGFFFFAHGGAWGSGNKWMYRLVSPPFLQCNIATVIVGYRTYPDGNVDDQVEDLEMAAEKLALSYPSLFSTKNREKQDWLGTCLAGHSSGAHIALLMLVNQIQRQMNSNMKSYTKNEIKPLPNRSSSNTPTIHFDRFIGLSGVYSINHHFDYEAGRGVEEISPMKPACGYSRRSFDHYSPPLRLKQLLSMTKQHTALANLIPKTLLIHGVEDDVVPFTSTSEAASIIRSCGARDCSEYYLPKTEHADVIIQLMLGGAVSHLLLQWLNEKGPETGLGGIQSKL